MRAFVTGGTGFIGGALVRRLRERGDDVVALVRSPARAAGLERLGATLVAGDLDDAAALERGLDGCDACFHVAAVYRVGIPAAERQRVTETNLGGTERVLDAAAEVGVTRSVHVSTVNVFGNTRGRVVDESYERDPGDGFLSCYDESKYRAHQAARERIDRGVPIVIVQPGAVYGPGDHSELGDQIDRARRGRLPFISFGALGLVMCHVEDVAGGILLAHDRGTVGRSYVLGGEVTTMKQVIHRVSRIAGRRPPRLAMPTWAIRAGIPLAPVLTRAMAMPPNLREVIAASAGVTYWASDARARSELGYAPRDLTTGLRQLVGAPA